MLFDDNEEEDEDSDFIFPRSIKLERPLVVERKKTISEKTIYLDSAHSSRLKTADQRESNCPAKLCHHVLQFHRPRQPPTKIQSPLHVTGYRSDIYTPHQKPALCEPRPPKSSLTSLKLSNSSQIRFKMKPALSRRIGNYIDPMYNAEPVFAQRISELTAHEADTIRYERSKRLKKK